MLLSTLIYSAHADCHLKLEATRTPKGWSFRYGDREGMGSDDGLRRDSQGRPLVTAKAGKDLDFQGLMDLSGVQTPSLTPDFWKRTWWLLQEGRITESRAQEKLDRFAEWLDVITKSAPYFDTLFSP